MADKAPTEVAPVPPRADFAPASLFKKATIADQSGAKPGFVRQWFHAKDPQSKGYYERYLQRRRLGNTEIGYAWAEPWSVVARADAKPGGKQRDDETKGLDTGLVHGDLICLETTEENFKLYQEEDRLRDEMQAKKLGNGDDEVMRDESGRPVARYRARVSDGTVTDPKQLLQRGA